MVYWKKNVNYMQSKGADGKVRHFIRIDGQDIEVEKELYREYAKMERRERYLTECEADTRLSLEQFAEDELSGAYHCGSYQESAEDTVMEMLDTKDRTKLLDALPSVLPQLPELEHKIIRALYFEAIPLREYARRLGITHRALQKQRDRILKKIKNLMVSEN